MMILLSRRTRLFVLLMIRLPPIYTITDSLFPYTTRLRSYPVRAPAAGGPMPRLELTYFDMHGGRGEPARLALHIGRSEEHTSELQSLMRISYAVSCLKNKHTELLDYFHLIDIHSKHLLSTSLISSYIVLLLLNNHTS